MTAPPQKVVELVGVPRLRREGRLDLLDRTRVQQVAELLDAHELAQQVAIERGACARRSAGGVSSSYM